MGDLYLLWIPYSGWGVFTASSCPDPCAFPAWMYRKYTVPSEQLDKVFGRLNSIKEKLETDKMLPAKGKEKEIFPELSDLLAD
jgi:hypothetical protein